GRDRWRRITDWTEPHWDKLIALRAPVRGQSGFRGKSAERLAVDLLFDARCGGSSSKLMTSASSVANFVAAGRSTDDRRHPNNPALARPQLRDQAAPADQSRQGRKSELRQRKIFPGR